MPGAQVRAQQPYLYLHGLLAGLVISSTDASCCNSRVNRQSAVPRQILTKDRRTSVAHGICCMHVCMHLSFYSFLLLSTFAAARSLGAAQHAPDRFAASCGRQHCGCGANAHSTLVVATAAASTAAAATDAVAERQQSSPGCSS